MALPVKLRQIASKAAGIYFIVTDDSGVANIEAESKLRTYFINSEKGPVNMLVNFAQGDTAALINTFGNATRTQHKKGNFGIQTCLDALSAGPIAVVNLRAFDNALDTTAVAGINPNILDDEVAEVAYTELFNTNRFWSPNQTALNDLVPGDTLLQFGNVANNDLSIFVTVAKEINVDQLTAEGDNTLEETILNVEEFPALNFESKVKDNFVDVYIFNNTFNPVTVTTNQYYGEFFDNNGNLDYTRISEFADVAESGFVNRYTGSLIPNLISENDENISIDTIINQDYLITGVICDINDDALEVDNQLTIDFEGTEFFDINGDKETGTSDVLLSHVVPASLTTDTVVYPLTIAAENIEPLSANLITYGIEHVSPTEFITSWEQGIRVDDIIQGVNGNVIVTSIEILDENAIIGATTDTYTKVKITCSAPVEYFNTDTEIIKKNFFVESSLLKPITLTSYKPRTAQFLDGSSTKQEEILNMMIQPGIVKGLSSVNGIRYIVDCFKSFVEPNYKHQYGTLANLLNDKNKFVAAIINEPFIKDIEKSTNPLFKDTPSSAINFQYLVDGGNKTYSTIFMTKYSFGEMYSFFYGPGDKQGNVIFPLAGKVSNVFYRKNIAYDIIANESGYVDNIIELEYPFDDEERIYLEKFRYNPIINFNGGNTIFGNLSGQKKVSKQQQIHNVELLLYIKENLYNLAKGDSFKKGTYDEYLKMETEAGDFMESLALDNAIEPDFIVKCSEQNNTEEIANNKIKLVEVEYTPFNALEKVVFSLKIN